MGQEPTDGKRLMRARRRLANLLFPDVEVYRAPPEVHVDWNVPVTLRDGTVLRVNVFRPATDERVPVIMSAHPYGKDRIPARTRGGRGVNFQFRLFPQPRRMRLSEWTSWEAPDPAVWVPRGYAVVNADLRGGGTAEGIGALCSDQEARDYYELIEWAGTRPWSTGRVGLDGVSYLAISQYKVAALHPPHLAAICPWEGFSDLYRDFSRPGGIRETGFSQIWSTMTARYARLHGDLRRELATRSERDAWYQALTPELEQIQVPLLVCGSFSDQSLHTRGSFEVFRRAGSAQKWLYTHRGGKWCEYYGEAASSVRQQFFDHALKGLSNGWQDEPPVRLAVHEAGPEPAAIVKEAAWPPADLEWTPLWLDAHQARLVAGEPPNVAGRAAFATRHGKRVFSWTIPHDMDLIGPMPLRLHLELVDAEDAYLFVGVRKLRGQQEVTFEGSYGFSGDMVTKGWQRTAHRALDERLSTRIQPVHLHDRTELLRAGEIVPLDVALLPQATRFRKGEQLRLEVGGRWHFPNDPLRGQFPARYQQGPKATCVLHCGGSYAAHLLIGHRPVAAPGLPL